MKVPKVGIYKTRMESIRRDSRPLEPIAECNGVVDVGRLAASISKPGFKVWREAVLLVEVIRDGVPIYVEGCVQMREC